MKVRCEKRGALSGCFTDGKLYEWTPAPPGMGGWVQDDLGLARFVIPGAPSPHLIPGSEPFGPGSMGRFIPVEET